MQVHRRMMDAIDRPVLEMFLQQFNTGVDHMPEIALLSEEIGWAAGRASSL